MIAVLVNVATVLLGSTIGLLFKKAIRPAAAEAIIKVLGLVTMIIGIMGAIETKSLLCLILSVVTGLLIGRVCKLGDGLDRAGERLKKIAAFSGTGGRFSEGFVSASLLFCVGAMTIMGSLEAGISGNYSIIFTKSLLDFFSFMMLASAMGIGVSFSALFVLVFQGGITLLGSAVAPYLTTAVVTEMSAAGGVILLGMGINMLGLSQNKLPVADVLPAILLPFLYLPLADWIGGLF